MGFLGKILIALLFFWLWVNIATHYYFCTLKNLCPENKSDKEAEAMSKIPNTLTVRADGIVVLENYPEFIFADNLDSIVIFQKHSDFLAQLSAMIKAQPNARLLVKGRYNSNENAVIGTKRAKFITEKLIAQYSVPELSVLQSSELTTEQYASGLGFELLGYIPKNQLLSAREDSIFLKQWKDSIELVSYNGILASFEPNLNDINLSAAFNEYCDSLKIQLKTKAKATIHIVGHCDSHSSDAEADKYGLHFAKLIAEHFKKIGIKNKISTSSKGKKELFKIDRLPDLSPDVLAIARNRRVTISVQENNVQKPKPKTLPQKK